MDVIKCTMVDERDKVLLASLLNEEFHIPAIDAIKTGDKVEIAHGVLEGFEGRTVKINKYCQTVDVEFANEFIRNAKSVTLAIKMGLL